MSGAILTADGSEISLANAATPGTPSGATISERTYAPLAGGGVAVLSQWSASSGQGLVLSLYDAAGNLTSSQDVVSSMSIQSAGLIALAGGGVAVDWSANTSPQAESGYDVYSAGGSLLGHASVNASPSAPSGFALPTGGFQLSWGGQTTVYDASGAATGQAPLSQPIVYAKAAGGAYLELQDNQLLFFNGSSFQPAQTLPNEAAHAITSEAAATLSGGNIGLAWTDGQAAYEAVFNTTTHTLSSPTLIDWGPSSQAAVEALPDGGFAVSWTEGGQQKGEAFGADGSIGPSLYLDGSVAGVTSGGDLVTVRQTASGTVEQHYSLSAAPAPQAQYPLYNYLGQLMPQSASNFDDITHSVHGPAAGGATIYAPVPGPSGVAASGGNNTIIASNGDNSYWIGASDTVVVPQGETGTKTIYVWNSEALPQGVNNLVFYGANNYGVGNSGDNIVMMGGNDVNFMDGGAGNDVLVGGFGRNTFAVAAGNGNDVIYNFHTWNNDAVRLTGTSFANFTQVQGAMTQVGADVVLQIDPNETLTFRSVKVSDFTAQNFLLPIDKSLLGGLTFDDEFNSLQLLNTTDGSGQWRPNFGTDPTSLSDYQISSNQEKQLYTAPGMVGQDGYDLSAYNPFSTSNGVLSITARRFDSTTAQHTWDQAYASGMLSSKGLFEQQYGYFEMRAELPTDFGSWPAFWLGQDPFNAGNEADVLEHLGYNPNVMYARTDDNGWVNGQTTYLADPSGFHTYGMLWTATETSFYVDGVAVMQLATPASWNSPMYMMLNLALGGWGGWIDENGLPAQMNIDYVRVYGLADGSSVVKNMTAANGYVEISDATYTAPANVNTIELVGSRQTITANDSGDTIISDNNINTLIGGAGADYFVIGRGGDTVTGRGGGDTFAFNEVPWNGATITDFAPGQDHVDLTNLLKGLKYAGSNAIADGYIRIADDGSGNAQILADVDKVSAGSGWWVVATLKGVHSASLQSGDIIYSGGGVMPPRGQTSNGGTPTPTPTPTPAPTPTPTGTSVSTSDSNYTAPAGVTTITLTGSNQTIHANNAGDTIWSDDTHNTLIGGTGADIFHIGRAGDTITGGAGNDTFAYAQVPWGGSTVTDFQSGDLIDLTGLMATTHDTGTDGFADGYLKLASDSSGNAQVWANYNVSGNNSWWLVTTLTGVSTAHLKTSGDTVVWTGATPTPTPTPAPTPTPTPTPAPTPTPTPTGTSVSTSDSNYTAPDGVTTITLTGSNQTIHANNGGDTIWSDDTHNTLIGGTGADVFHIGRAGDTVTGGAGNDIFAYAQVPWGGSTITDFHSGDVIDLSGAMQTTHDTGTDGFADGYLKLASDSSGNAQIWANYNVSGNNSWWLVTTLTGVSTTSLHTSGNTVLWTGATPTPTPTPAPTPTPTPAPTPTPTGASVSTSDSNYTAPDGVTTITLTGSNQTIHANNGGDIIWSDDTHNTLIGGTGADTFHIGRAGDIITGGSGNDTFAYAQVPWGGSTITDFQSGDLIDLTGLMSTTHDTGTDGFADGYLKIASDTAGNAQIWANYNVSGNNSWWLVTTLNGVSSTSLHTSGDTVVWASSAGPTSVSTSDPNYTAPAGVTTITLTGSNQTIHANNAGDTIWSDDSKNVLIGGTGADVFHIGRAGDTITGGAGNDTFAYAQVPWGGSTITDFQSGDMIDLTGLMSTTHDTGTDGFADGYLKITSDSAGNAQLWANYNVAGNNNWWLVTTLDGVAASSLHTHGAFVTG